MFTLHKVIQKGSALVIIFSSKNRVNVAVNRQELEQFKAREWKGPKRVIFNSMGFDAIERSLDSVLEFLEKNPDDRVKEFDWGWTIAPPSPAFDSSKTGSKNDPRSHRATIVIGFANVAALYPEFTSEPNKKRPNPKVETMDKNAAEHGYAFRVEVVPLGMLS